ncbi:conserved hypothetical protein [Leishmania braziliensis MHOM/BR/75/M2904]|uniref:Uncharacterized protein n=2 Tax=Leishmania braziliensis TaxID=5660 RepID=A4HLH4_LEIBR|nr:conserved hypothetical protein [Leishmania braziliensis MHOM/BR/75/M2904]KAI5686967.1 hypothetical protein MNV84_07001 [Leishmania braziliensis]CAJ2479431.1 unnamed protein product [Leishmania braziliensis]CAM40670.1 conserved hypothetical protein [Leishmania braziliensis MHOM/BR/75/M2904]SYZ69080.1 hypothetical_protein [Leishmania braziliensis MHOM/BR/75/M2904]
MPDSGNVVHHPLVRVRGGATMLLAALIGALPPPAQVVLRRALRVISVMTLAKVQRTAVLMLARRLLLPLITGAFPTASGAFKPAKLNSSSATLIEALSHAFTVYSLAKKLIKADRGDSFVFTAATAACLSSEEGPLCRLLGAVVGTEALSLSSALPSVPPSVSTAAPPRMRSALFSTTTPVALNAYLRYVHARTRASHVAILVPGLLTAPWTTHLIPVLRDAFRSQGTTVVGYDICADAEHYDVDLRHLRDLIRQVRRSTAKPCALSSASSAASLTGVLVLASVRGRSVRNGDEACVLVKMHGWQVVELCVPTLPLDAVHDLDPKHRPQWMRKRQAQCTTLSVRPDVRLTAFDDAGMYGGAVVELCSDDSALLLHMKSQCQPGQVENRGGDAVWQTKARSYPRLTATLDAVTGASKFIIKVWCPWAHRLCAVAWQEAGMQHQGTAMAQEALAMLHRFPTQTLPRVPLYAQAQLRRWLLRRRGGTGTTDDDGISGVASHRVSADTPVEKRTTYITHPVATDSVQGGKKSLTVVKSESSARIAAAALTAPEEMITNCTMEWQIRLRWSVLLMSPTFSSDSAPRVTSDAAGATRTFAAYLSLWSFVAQLPPWVVAVSAADDGETARGERRSSCCVEAFATALLVRVADPASPRATAELLRNEALVEAAAVRPRAWDSLATARDASGVEVLRFEDAVVFPGCAQATRLSEELLYLPLSPDLPVSVRAAMLRLLWDEVPHAGGAASESVHSRQPGCSRAAGALSAHVQATMNSIYRAYLPQAQRGHDGKALPSSASGSNTLPSAIAQSHSREGVISAQDATRVEQFLFDGVSSSSSVASPLSAGAILKSIAQTFIPALGSNL